MIPHAFRVRLARPNPSLLVSPFLWARLFIRDGHFHTTTSFILSTHKAWPGVCFFSTSSTPRTTASGVFLFLQKHASCIALRGPLYEDYCSFSTSLRLTSLYAPAT